MKDEIIDNYIKGELEGAAKQAFEKEMNSDQELAKEVEFRNYLTKHLEFESMAEEAHEQMLLKEKEEKGNTIALSEEGNTSTSDTRYIKNRKIYGMVASIAILVLGSVSYANLNYSNQELINEQSFFSIERALILPNTKGNSQRFGNGLKFFGDHKYQEAITQFEGIPEVAGEDFMQAQAYLAYAYWKLNVPQKTKDICQKNIATTSRDNRQIIEWLLIQSKLSLKERDNSFYSLLQKIQKNTNHKFSNDANELIKELNNPWRKLVW